MNTILIHRLEVPVVFCLEDWVRYVSPGYLGDPLCYYLLDADCRQSEDVLSIGLVLGVAVVFNLGFDVVGAGALGGRSRRREYVPLLDVHG